MQFCIFIFLRSSSHLFLGLPVGLAPIGCHFYILLTTKLSSGILLISPNQTYSLCLYKINYSPIFDYFVNFVVSPDSKFII
ncbi:hypothetical protein C0J52_13649 [Blattella germanica]|nr:hypothetical protein C0J52_13649 [Blattella germanica]